MGYTVARLPDVETGLARLHHRFAEHTMLPEELYRENLAPAEQVREVAGDVVECGVWKGGMIAGLACVLGPNRKYHLFDSFRGLPPATSLDGEKAVAWQNDVEHPTYLDNCSAPPQFAKNAMDRTGVRYQLHEGWFEETVPRFARNGARDIALLRLDGDWYESTMCCLEHLYPLVANRGMIIIDDYYFWDGCSRAVHDYFSRIKSSSKVRSSPGGVAYVVKEDG